MRHTKVESEDHDLTNVLQSVLVSSLSTVQFLILSVPDEDQGTYESSRVLGGNLLAGVHVGVVDVGPLSVGHNLTSLEQLAHQR